MNIPLKAKYRNPGRLLWREEVEAKHGVPPPGTWVYNAGSFKSKTSNAGTATKVRTLRPRRRAWGPWLGNTQT